MSLLRLHMQSQDDREHKWRIQAVSESAGSFVNRKSLPKAWQGLRDSNLDKAAGIDGETS
jgi:uncharacterized UPF0160 family protein